MNIDKHIVLVVSGGRTGTMFLGDLLETVVDRAFSVHEPDVFAGFTGKTWKRIRRFGLYHMIVGRALGRTGMRNLSLRYLSGRLDLEDLTREIRKQRERYYESIDEDLVIESNHQWYGILPGAARAFPRYRIVAIVRDPRPWVESWLALGVHHGPRDRVRKWGFPRINPELVGDTEFFGEWDQMSPFEKNCWNWRTIYGQVSKWTERDPNCRLYHFSDLFLAEDREETFRDMLDFITEYADRRFRYEFDPAILEVRRNQSRDASPSEVARKWRQWSPERARRLDDICGELMRKLGYGHEPEWQEMIQRPGEENRTPV